MSCCHGSWACMRITGLALGPLGSAAAHTPRGGIDQEQNTRLPHPWCVLCCELCRVWVARGCGRVWCCQVRAIGDWILWQPRVGSAAGKDATTAVVLSSVSWFIASISSLIVLLLLPPANYLSPHSAPLCPCTILPSRDASSSPLSLGAREVFAVLPKRAYCAYFIHWHCFGTYGWTAFQCRSRARLSLRDYGEIRPQRQVGLPLLVVHTERGASITVVLALQSRY